MARCSLPGRLPDIVRGIVPRLSVVGMSPYRTIGSRSGRRISRITSSVAHSRPSRLPIVPVFPAFPAPVPSLRSGQAFPSFPSFPSFPRPLDALGLAQDIRAYCRPLAPGTCCSCVRLPVIQRVVGSRRILSPPNVRRFTVARPGHVVHCTSRLHAAPGLYGRGFSVSAPLFCVI
jgi:hypothetical protein